jgi:hypothetical protein
MCILYTADAMLNLFRYILQTILTDIGLKFKREKMFFMVRWYAAAVSYLSLKRKCCIMLPLTHVRTSIYTCSIKVCYCNVRLSKYSVLHDYLWYCVFIFMFSTYGFLGVNLSPFNAHLYLYSILCCVLHSNMYPSMKCEYRYNLNPTIKVSCQYMYMIIQEYLKKKKKHFFYIWFFHLCMCLFLSI